MTKLDDLKYEVNTAVLEAIDAILVERYGKVATVKDADLPSILPHVERLVETRLRAVYDYLPEALSATPKPIDTMALALLGVRA